MASSSGDKGGQKGVRGRSHEKRQQAPTTTQPAVNQVKFHAGMWTRDGAEHQTKRYCDQKGITFEAYSPLGVGGVLSDADLVQIAAAHGKSPAQVALKWLADKGLAVVTKANSVEYLQQDIDLFSWNLTASETSTLSKNDEYPSDPSWACSK